MKNILLYGLIAVGAYYAYKHFDDQGKRKWLLDFGGNDAVWQEIIKRMTDQEVDDVYEFLTKYARLNESDPQKPLPPALAIEIQKISNKYNIFT